MPKSKVRKKTSFTPSAVSRTPVKVKGGPSSMWFVALFLGLMLFGLVWLMVYQLAATGLDTPAALTWMSELGPWNYAIAFAFMITGLLLTMRWR
ncbi:cell division protein CrgA [Mycolicibacter sinensis]|uniref:Cell division protein CrgA n=1 Tax=Mycolicibacter sinensis (strain JDM601) TaxID=875328 RepID=A0A1A3U4B6_MYCSD|nr:cell division protein CrgA [Mycolicibacter sinensis]OBK89729.1 cell division protein CrgA [Mycolicibacter sinensis]